MWYLCGMDATWKPIPGTDGLYEVSDEGHIRSYVGPRRALRSEPHLLHPRQNTSGYFQVTIRMDGETKPRLLHRLVLLTFRGPPVAGDEGSHLNDIPTDNRLENLVWETRSLNCKRRRVPTGEKSRQHKLTQLEVDEIRRLHATGISYRRLGAMFNVTNTNIRYIIIGKTWRQ